MDESVAQAVEEQAAAKSPLLSMRDVAKHYFEGKSTLDVLRGASLDISAGECVGLVAPSGAGKSTLLHIAGLLEKPDAGEVLLNGKPCGTLSDRARTRIRRLDIGFVYQFHHLLPEFTAVENVMFPQLIRGLSKAEATARSKELLAYLKLGDRFDHRPSELSGGEQQRVAIARAVANAPRLLLADEPTGNLDPETAGYVFRVLIELVRATGLAALVATHNLDLAAQMDRRITIEDGGVIPYES